MSAADEPEFASGDPQQPEVAGTADQLIGAVPDSEQEASRVGGATPATLMANARQDLRTARQQWDVRRLIGGQSYRRRGWAGLLAVVAATGIFGGLGAVPHQGVPTVAPGTAIDGSPWDVTVESSRVVPGDSLGSLRPGTDRHWLAVVATVTVTSDSPQFLTGLSDSDPGLLTIDGAEGIESSHPDQIALLRDASTAPRLQPGVPERVAFLWGQQDSAANPTALTVTIYNSAHVRDSNGDLNWLFPKPHAEVVVPVQIGAKNSSPGSGNG